MPTPGISYTEPVSWLKTYPRGGRLSDPVGKMAVVTLTDSRVVDARPTPEPDPPSEAPHAAGRRLPGKKLGIRFSVFTVGSVISTLISQAVLDLVYWGFGNGAALASVLAFVAGAIPNFLINWHFTWGRRGRPQLLTELLPYAAIVIGGGLAATSVTTLADHVLAPLLSGRGEETIALDVVYLGSYALFFVLKFALLNTVFTRRAGTTRRPRRGPATGVPAEATSRS